ncbi:hypothetical protein HOO65_050255 [Ceratocystis lukuohia]|uniref:Uncharacterized protein n=1 Tax=Ceratocystis lukuohia TaxID=2019550 RepID=A0ABR4MFV1_9PEZI
MHKKPLLTTDSGELLSPDKPFDPKAVTRESWKKPKPKPPQDGPYISFNVHPDAYIQHLATSRTSWHLTKGSRQGIKWTRLLQLVLRILEALAAVGVLSLFIAFTKVPSTTSWVFRITGGVVSLHCSYSTYHHYRSPVGRSPASIAAYQIFSGFADAAVIGIYSYGIVTVDRDGHKWSTILDPSILNTMISATFYGLISAAAVHVISLFISAWLGYIFRRISSLPPDMNPLDVMFTSRKKHHKKSKSSVGSTLSTSLIKKDVFGASEAHKLSSQAMEELDSPRHSIPFLETLQRSPQNSEGRKNALVNLPSRQYQIVPSNTGAHSSEYRRSAATSTQTASYSEVPSHESSPIKSRPPTAYYTPQDMSPTKSRPSTGYSASHGYDTPPRMSPSKSRPTTSYSSPNDTQSRATAGNARDMSPLRAPAHAGAWSPSDPGIGRTHKRPNTEGVFAKRPYEALQQMCDESDSDDMMGNSDFEGDAESERGHGRYRNPLRRNPVRMGHDLPPPPPPHGAKPRAVQVNQEVGMQSPTPLTSIASPSTSYRKSSIQTENQFSSKSYGALGQGFDTVNIGGNRQVSSGIDYEASRPAPGLGRRHVSGKVAEEGRVVHTSEGYSRFSGYQTGRS